MTNESGRYFDNLDDSVIAAYVNARGFMWTVESIERLTIGPETDLADGDRDGAVAWSIPISYLGLYYSVLEVFFPLSEASVRDLPNDILRVLHVALGSNGHDGQLALNPVSDDHLAESRRQVLLELERRGFEAFQSRGLAHQHMQGLLYDRTGAFKSDEPIASTSKQQPATPSSSKRPNASVLQPDRQRQTATPSTNRPAAVTVPSQQTDKFFGTAMENAQIRIDTCRHEIQDKPGAFLRDGRGPSCKKFNEKPYECSESQLLFPYSVPVDAYAKATGKGKARATSDHEEDWETTDHSVAASSPKGLHPDIWADASEDEEPEHAGSASAHVESEHEDLYGVSDKGEPVRAYEESEDEDLYGVSDKETSPKVRDDGAQ